MLTIAVHYGYRKLRSTTPSKILLQLCVALLAGLLLFVIAGRGVVSGGSGGCQTIAILMQYFWLCALAWMVCEGANLYAVTVIVLGLDFKRRLRIYSAVAWGMTFLCYSSECML